MKLALDFGASIGIHYVHLPKVTEGNFRKIEQAFKPLVNSSKMKSREAIAEGFLYSVQECPEENPSDLWHHVLYRIYLKEKVGTNPSQSWVRTSGEAFELAMIAMYNPLLKAGGIRLRSLISKAEKISVLKRLDLGDRVGSSKIDVLIEKRGEGRGIDSDNYGIIGGIHAKASLAERVSDDIPTSRILMKEGLLSILITLDVKSFPPPQGDLVNRGELGTPASPSDKRKYIEEHGDFSACFSYNLRTVPSGSSTSSGKYIFVPNLQEQPDSFARFLLDHRG